MKREFFEYCKSFYGKGQIYDLKAPNHVIKSACAIVEKRNDIPFDGDTVDREAVRHILELLGYGK